MSSRPEEPFATVINYNNYGNTYVYSKGMGSASWYSRPRGPALSPPGYTTTRFPTVHQGFYAQGANRQAMYPDNQFHDGRVAPPLIYGPSYQDYQHSVFRLATAPPIMNQTINHNYYFGEGHYGYKSEFRQQETHHWNRHQKLPKDKTARLTSDAGSQYTCRSCDCKDCLEERTAKTVFRGMTDSEKHVFLSGRFGKREDERFEDDVQREVDKMMLNVNETTQEMSSTAVYRGTPVEDSKPRTVRRRASASSVSSTISIPKQYTPMEDSQPCTVHRQASTSSVSSSTISIPRRYTPPADYDFFCASPPRPTYAQPSYGFSAYRHLSTHSHSFPAHIPTPYPAYGPWDPNQPMQYQPPKVETISSSSRSSPAQDERHNVHFSEENKGSVPGSWPETPKKKSGCGWNPKTPSPVGSSMLRNAPSSNDAWNKATSFGNSIKGPYPCGRNSPISPSPKVRNDSPKMPVQSSPIFMEESKPSVPSWGACSPKASNQGWDNGVTKSPIPSKPTTPGRASDLPKASDQGWDNSPVKPTTSGWATDSPKASVPGWGNSPAKPTTSEWATDSPKASVRGWGDNPVEPTATGWATDSLKASPTIEAGLGNNSIKSPAPGWVIDSPKTSVQGWGGGPIQSPAPEEATRSPGASGDWRGNSSTKPLASERVTSPQKASVEGWGGSPSPQRRYGVRASHAPPQPSPLKWEAKVASPVPSWNGTGGYPLRVTVHQPVKESESQDSEKGCYGWGTNTTAEGAKDSWGSPAAGGSGNGNWADVSPPLRGTW